MALAEGGALLRRLKRGGALQGIHTLCGASNGTTSWSCLLRLFCSLTRAHSIVHGMLRCLEMVFASTIDWQYVFGIHLQAVVHCIGFSSLHCGTACIVRADRGRRSPRQCATAPPIASPSSPSPCCPSAPLSCLAFTGYCWRYNGGGGGGGGGFYLLARQGKRCLLSKRSSLLFLTV